jgi:sporulation protein YlmC with PRC-barrel domain
MKKFVVTVALVAGVALATSVLAQSSGSPPASTSPPPASSQPSPSASGQSPAGQGVLVDANSIVGATVRGADGKEIGKVERLMVDPKDGRVRTVVVKQGGTLGVGGKSVSVPWESMKVAQDGDQIVVTAQQQMLEQAPAASPRTDSKSGSDSDKSDKK